MNKGKIMKHKLVYSPRGYEYDINKIIPIPDDMLDKLGGEDMVNAFINDNTHDSNNNSLVYYGDGYMQVQWDEIGGILYPRLVHKFILDGGDTIFNNGKLKYKVSYAGKPMDDDLISAFGGIDAVDDFVEKSINDPRYGYVNTVYIEDYDCMNYSHHIFHNEIEVKGYGRAVLCCIGDAFRKGTDIKFSTMNPPKGWTQIISDLQIKICGGSSTGGEIYKVCIK